MKKYMIAVAITFALLTACNDDEEKIVRENPSSFTEVGNIDLGNTGASEITAYDPKTKRLFVVCNDGSSRIDVLDLSSPASPSKIQSIDILPYGSGVNSVAVKNGRLAAAIEATNKQDNGKVVVFDTQNLSVVRQVTVGAMPDMITYSPDGKFILTANEGEPNSAYTNDPEGSVSIISVNENYSVVT
ncbi:MAG: alkaline phosphatase, partial [Flammeovirgaceae bacterium]|nr:alkaline phosphatase [Flammeovirgaceae bacterium]MDW8288131.1 alkaline phosphatase [Flammeovirgaceae bacterium]